MRKKNEPRTIPRELGTEEVKQRQVMDFVSQCDIVVFSGDECDALIRNQEGGGIWNAESLGSVGVGGMTCDAKTETNKGRNSVLTKSDENGDVYERIKHILKNPEKKTIESCLEINRLCKLKSLSYWNKDPLFLLDLLVIILCEFIDAQLMQFETGDSPYPVRDFFVEIYWKKFKYLEYIFQPMFKGTYQSCILQKFGLKSSDHLLNNNGSKFNEMKFVILHTFYMKCLRYDESRLFYPVDKDCYYFTKSIKNSCNLLREYFQNDLNLKLLEPFFEFHRFFLTFFDPENSAKLIKHCVNYVIKNLLTDSENNADRYFQTLKDLRIKYDPLYDFFDTFHLDHEYVEIDETSKVVDYTLSIINAYVITGNADLYLKLESVKEIIEISTKRKDNINRFMVLYFIERHMKVFPQISEDKIKNIIELFDTFFLNVKQLKQLDTLFESDYAVDYILKFEHFYNHNLKRNLVLHFIHYLDFKLKELYCLYEDTDDKKIIENVKTINTVISRQKNLVKIEFFQLFKNVLIKRLVENLDMDNFDKFLKVIEMELLVSNELKIDNIEDSSKDLTEMIKSVELGYELGYEFQEVENDKEMSIISIDNKFNEFSKNKDELYIPSNIYKKFKKFKKFLKEKKCKEVGHDKKINFDINYELSKAEIEFSLNSSETLLIKCGFFESLIIMKFDETDKLSIQELLKATNINSKKMDRTLDILTRGKNPLFLKDDVYLFLNKGFKITTKLKNNKNVLLIK